MNSIKLEWKRGDWAAYFGLMTNNLTNLLTMMGLLIFVVGIPTEIVYGRIAPAFGLAVLAASVCYSWFGLQMVKKTGRSDVTALPSGPKRTLNLYRDIPGADAGLSANQRCQLCYSDRIGVVLCRSVDPGRWLLPG